MDNTTLENSIREEASRAITAIREKEALEMRQMDEIFSMEMEDFRRQAEADRWGSAGHPIRNASRRGALASRQSHDTSIRARPRDRPSIGHGSRSRARRRTASQRGGLGR